MPISNTMDLVKIIKYKPTDFAGYCTKFDKFVRHPSVWPYALSSALGVLVLKTIATGHSDETKQTTQFLNRDILKEEYKAKHGHYPH